jgi:hypothetical protein
VLLVVSARYSTITDRRLSTHFVMPEVNFPPDLLNFLELSVREVGQRIHLDELLDVIGVTRGRDGHDALLDRPEKQDRSVVNGLAGVFGQSLGDPLQDGLEGSAGRVTQERRERPVGLRNDAVLGLDG